MPAADLAQAVRTHFRRIPDKLQHAPALLQPVSFAVGGLCINQRVPLFQSGGEAH